MPLLMPLLLPPPAASHYAIATIFRLSYLLIAFRHAACHAIFAFVSFTVLSPLIFRCAMPHADAFVSICCCFLRRRHTLPMFAPCCCYHVADTPHTLFAIAADEDAAAIPLLPLTPYCQIRADDSAFAFEAC